MNQSINALKMLGITAINKAKSGHPGIVLGAAPMAYTLFTNHIRTYPKYDKWINRDRFILSAGHGSALLYSLLHLSGFDVSIEDLKNFRQLDSITPGHPEYGLTAGVDATTGPLGQGIAMAVGQALSETILSSKYNKPQFNLFDHFTYVICGDGDLQEGVAQEAISLAGHWKLNKLIVLFDSNDVQLDHMVNIAQSDNMELKFKAANWNYILVKNGHDVEEINRAINSAKESDKPTLIEVKTIIGEGATKQGTPSVHGAPLNDDINVVKAHLNWNYDDFEIPKEVYEDFHQKVFTRGENEYNSWQEMLNKYKQSYPDLYTELQSTLNDEITINENDFSDLLINKPQSTRISSGLILDRCSELLPNLVGGSADLSGSTKAKGANGIYQFNNHSGRDIAYGVREFAMSAINNGIALHKGLIPFASGFFVFADYMKPAIRLSSLMHLPVLYILSHDSVAVGEDGPTHQPIEQLAMLRSQPNLLVFRPCDFNETLGSYLTALQQKNTPSAILVSRQDLPQIPSSNVTNVSKGAYVIYGTAYSDITIYATGSEVSLAISVAKIIEQMNVSVRVVSVVCWELFEIQPNSYKEEIINKSSFRVSLELASTFGWERFTGDNGLNIGLNHFGLSAPYNDIMQKLGFETDKLVNKIMENYVPWKNNSKPNN